MPGSLLEVALLVMGVAPFAVYLCVRLGAAAYFRSKRDHESQRQRKD